jgi:SPP1 family predicted phage head-tail adaptor
MRAGALRHVIYLQNRSTSIENHEEVSGWETYSIVRAEKVEPKGDEAVQSLLANSFMTVVFRVRYRSSVSPTHRVLFESRIFDIRSVTNPDGKKIELELVCTEHFSDGD